jgi:predicted nucleotidyltransferase
MTAALPIPRAEIQSFCRRNGVRRLALFGSVLTPRFGPESDVDILIEFQQDKAVGFFQFARMEHELSRLFGDRKVDLRTPNDLSIYFRDEVKGNSLVAYDECL